MEAFRIRHLGRALTLPLIALVAALGAFAPPALAASAFTPVAGSPFSGDALHSGNVGANTLSFSPGGNFLAVSDYGAGLIRLYSVAPGGTLSPTSHTVATPDVTVLRFSPSGQYLAALSATGDVYLYAVAADGVLTAVPGSPFGSVAGYGMAWNPAGTLLATVGQNTIELFAVGSGGTLGFASSTGDSGNPISVAFSPSGSLLAVANQNARTTGLYSVGATGKLGGIANPSLGAAATPYSVAFSPTTAATTLAVADYSDGDIQIYGASSTGLTPQTTVQTGASSGPRMVTFSSDGRLLASANAGGTTTIFAATQSYAPLPGSPLYTGSTPTEVAFGDGNGVLAATSEYSNTISVFSVAPPGVTIERPALMGDLFNLRSYAATVYSCSDSLDAPGIKSCVGSGSVAPTGTGSSAYGVLNTDRLGPHTFTVTAISVDGQTTSQTVSYDVVAPKVSVTSGRLTVSGGRASVPLRCTGGAPGGVCHGTITLQRTVGHHRRTLGRAGYRLPSGARETVSLRVASATGAVTAVVTSPGHTTRRTVRL